MKEHNPNWPQISDNPYRILKFGGSEYWQPDIDKIYLYAKDLMKQNINS